LALRLRDVDDLEAFCASAARKFLRRKNSTLREHDLEDLIGYLTAECWALSPHAAGSSESRSYRCEIRYPIKIAAAVPTSTHAASGCGLKPRYLSRCPIVALSSERRNSGFLRNELLRRGTGGGAVGNDGSLPPLGSA